MKNPGGRNIYLCREPIQRQQWIALLPVHNFWFTSRSSKTEFVDVGAPSDGLPFRFQPKRCLHINWQWLQVEPRLSDPLSPSTPRRTQSRRDAVIDLICFDRLFLLPFPTKSKRGGALDRVPLSIASSLQPCSPPGRSGSARSPLDADAAPFDRAAGGAPCASWQIDRGSVAEVETSIRGRVHNHRPLVLDWQAE